MRTVAFYLPQFHAIRENDEWWGAGFTEWVNVRRARPLFEGHEHPRRAGVLGEYDLTDRDVHRAQTALATSAGIDAFCMYFYWFGGQRLLEAPVEAWREDPELLPYCLSWANESWSRRWDGKSRSVLISQDYEPGFAAALLTDLLPHFRAPHYMKQDGAPVLVVHRAQDIPDVKTFARILREGALEAGLPGVHLVAAETTPGLIPEALGFDAVAEFPPVGANTLRSLEWGAVENLDRGFRGRLLSYERMSQRFAKRREPGFVRYRGVTPSWDNSARRRNHATVYVGATPSLYARWLLAARRSEAAARGTRGLVFINAWNEWAEGAYLEPDELNGDDYLQATRNPSEFRGRDTAAPRRASRIWSWPQTRSAALISLTTMLALARRAQNALRRPRA